MQGLSKSHTELNELKRLQQWIRLSTIK